MFSYIHGIEWRHVKDQPTFGELWPKIAVILHGARFFAAHNAPFDRGVLNSCCAVAGVPAPKLPFVCTVRLARKAWNLRPTKLPDVCRHLGITLNHHEALSDASACAKIVLAAAADGAFKEEIKTV
jgi:DNA polymerase-3 subunit epsilon